MVTLTWLPMTNISAGNLSEITGDNKEHKLKNTQKIKPEIYVLTYTG